MEQVRKGGLPPLFFSYLFNFKNLKEWNKSGRVACPPFLFLLVQFQES
jgi:hypothetical protein